MELNSFKAILLRKAGGNDNLLSLISGVDEDFLVNSVVEALEKMAKPTNLTGTNANGPLTSFGTNIDKTDVNQLRDALGHHLSHYKAALKAHHAAPEGPDKAKMRQVADQHLNHVIPLMHLAARAGAHSQGKLGIDYPPLAPWETNYTTLERTDKGRFLRDPKLLRVRPSQNARRDDSGDKITTGIPDYRYLEMPPHPGHEANATMPHTGGYPWEEVQVGAPADIDAKKAYLHVEDIADKKDYVPHEFDKHPIRNVADIQADYLTPETLQNHANEMQGWRGGEHHKKWIEGQREKYTADREGYTKRGQTKGPHFYEGIPLQEQPRHVHRHPVVQKVAPKAETAQAPAAQPAAAGQPVKPQPVRVRPGATKKEQAENEMEAAYNAVQLVPKEHREALLAIPALRDYAIKRGLK
jgi:hypothetical protein